MKYLTSLLLALLAGPALAVTMTFAPAPGGATLIDFETPSAPAGPGVVSWDNSNIYTATDIPNAAQPLPDGVGKYLASNVPGEVSGTTSILFGGVADYLGFFWGSPDTYNTIQFFKGGVSQGIFTGATVFPANGDQGASPYVGFTNVQFDRVDLSSSQYNFELDTLRFTRPFADPQNPDAVPEGGASLAVLGGLMGLGAIIRSRRK